MFTESEHKKAGDHLGSVAEGVPESVMQPLALVWAVSRTRDLEPFSKSLDIALEATTRGNHRRETQKPRQGLPFSACHVTPEGPCLLCHAHLCHH